mmetsp:Transcript_6922/g.19483  ORF Transcript_6922/g.19483 Transcript_6922/m.19483 type:complete len:255 (-) Transcript_6922:15-779(-)
MSAMAWDSSPASPSSTVNREWISRNGRLVERASAIPAGHKVQRCRRRWPSVIWHRQDKMRKQLSTRPAEIHFCTSPHPGVPGQGPQRRCAGSRRPAAPCARRCRGPAASCTPDRPRSPSAWPPTVWTATRYIQAACFPSCRRPTFQRKALDGRNRCGPCSKLPVSPAATSASGPVARYAHAGAPLRPRPTMAMHNRRRRQGVQTHVLKGSRRIAPGGSAATGNASLWLPEAWGLHGARKTCRRRIPPAKTASCR